MEFLPTELSQEIFFRLPCKDISSCKCVCRAWYKLLSHPNFTKNYTRNSPFAAVFFILNRRPTTNSCFLLEFAANGDVIRTPLKQKIPDFEHINTHSGYIGSCNGLLFLWTQEFLEPRNRVVEKVYCCNPLFEGCAAIAEHERPYGPGDWWLVDYMIGYTSSTINFKLLRVVFQAMEKVVRADVLTVGVDCKWRRVDDHLDLCYVPRGVSFNGAYLYIFNHENVRHLCTFDFGEEKSGWKSKLPDSLQHKNKWRLQLIVLNNHISVVDSSDHSYIAVWTMEEYGVAESWSRKIIIRSWSLHWCHPRVPDLKAVAALPNGDILFSGYSFRGNILSLNPEREHAEIEVYEIGQYGAASTVHAAEFAPRFYPLGEDIRGRRRWDARKVWSSILCFYRIVLERFLCVKDN